MNKPGNTGFPLEIVLSGGTLSQISGRPYAQADAVPGMTRRGAVGMEIAQQGDENIKRTMPCRPGQDSRHNL